MSDERYLTFALGKGRLAKQTLKTFEKIGITCEEMKDPATRKLIFVNEEMKMRFFLAKGPDVPTYVEYGAADIGIVGEDTILEEARNIYEVLDLGFGKCRMCVCGPEKSRELLQHHELIRVATKYPSNQDRTGSHRGAVRGHCGHRGDRQHPEGKRPSGVGGGLSPVRPDGGQPGQHEDGKREDHSADPEVEGSSGRGRGSEETGGLRLR